MGDVYQLTNACEPNTYRLSNTLFYTLPQNALIAPTFTSEKVCSCHLELISYITNEACLVNRGLNASVKTVSSQVSLRGLHRLTGVETFFIIGQFSVDIWSRLSHDCVACKTI